LPRVPPVSSSVVAYDLIPGDETGLEVLKRRADDDLGRNLADEEDALVNLRRHWRLMMVDVRVALDMVDLIARPAI